MPLQLRHHDLISVPSVGIYWLRLYSDDGDQVAVVVITEIPGNTGFSVTKAISRVTGHVISKFGLPIHHTRLFAVYPKGFPGKSVGLYQEVHVRGRQPCWTGTSRVAIEDAIGNRLTELPTHEVLYERVRDKGGGNAQTLYRPVLIAMSVDQLPAPHQPFRCAHGERFRAFDHQINPESTAEGALLAGRRFLSSLTAEDRRKCSYHCGNWKAVADASVEILADPRAPDPKSYVALAHQEKRWLQSLFKDPVTVREGQYGNGQHRGCALRFSGAKRAVVSVRDEVVGQVSSDWTYLGDG